MARTTARSWRWPVEERAHGPDVGQLYPIRAKDAPGGLAGFGVGDEPTTALAAEEHVGGNVEVVAQGQVLPHHRQAAVGAPRGPDARAPDPDLADVGRDVAGDAAHKGRLSSAVLPGQGHELARPHLEVHAV